MLALTAQLYVLAAFIVLCVPMGLAGWHLTRHKALFLAVALFVSLTLCAHLSPFLPGVRRSIPSPPLSAAACLPFLHRLSWCRSPEPSWSWSPNTTARSCGFARLSRAEASLLLNGSWVLVAGDSQARLLVLALVRLLLSPSESAAAEPELFRRHSDYRVDIPDRGIRVDFVWAPFEANLTDLLNTDFLRTGRVPDVLVLGSGLWHMLHISNPWRYGAQLDAITQAASELSATTQPRPPHMFWLGLPWLISPRLNTAAKRERMNATMLNAYNREVDIRRITRQSGGPFLLLDVGTLTHGCGSRCTVDGMHYHDAVYEAVLHVMLNALIVESQQI